MQVLPKWSCIPLMPFQANRSSFDSTGVVRPYQFVEVLSWNFQHSYSSSLLFHVVPRCKIGTLFSHAQLSWRLSHEDTLDLTIWRGL